MARKWSATFKQNTKKGATNFSQLPDSESGGQRRIRTFVGSRQQIYSLPHLTALVSARYPSRGGGEVGSPIGFGKGKTVLEPPMSELLAELHFEAGKYR